jgi:hypothetical protein
MYPPCPPVGRLCRTPIRPLPPSPEEDTRIFRLTTLGVWPAWVQLGTPVLTMQHMIISIHILYYWSRLQGNHEHCCCGLDRNPSSPEDARLGVVVPPIPAHDWVMGPSICNKESFQPSNSDWLRPPLSDRGGRGPDLDPDPWLYNAAIYICSFEYRFEFAEKFNSIFLDNAKRKILFYCHEAGKIT